ncbi:MAG: FHA domain-containing protein [Myxococcota bacterium]
MAPPSEKTEPGIAPYAGEADEPSEPAGLPEDEDVAEDSQASVSHSETRIGPLDALDDEEPDEDDENATRAGPPLQLKIIAGPDAGKTRTFKGARMVIGRTPDCDLKLSDPSVSRRHLELLRAEEGVLLRDLGSGNGSKVNGKKVTEQLLQHDDEIAIGKTKFRFVDEMSALKKLREEAEGQAQAPEEKEPPSQPEGSSEEESSAFSQEEVDPADPALRAATNPSLPVASARPPLRRDAPAPKRTFPWQRWEKKQRLLAAGGASLLLLVVVLAIATRKPAPPPVDPRKAQAQEKMQQARTAIRADKLEEAVKLIEEAEKLLPGSDTEGLLERASAEMGAQKTLETARALVRQGRFDQARQELAHFPEVSDKRMQEKETLAQDIDRLELEQKREQVELLLASGDLQGAKALHALLPAPQRQLLRAKLEEAEAAAAEQERAEQRRTEKARALSTQRRAQERAEEMDAAFAVVARKLHGGEYERAAAECDRVIDAYRGDGEIRARAKRLKALLPAFGRAFEEGHKKFKANQLLSAVRPLRRARELYREIGFHGALGEQVNEELGAAALAAGRDALLRDDLATAAVNYQEAAQLSPDDPRVREGLEKVSAKAEELFQSAYMIRDRDPREAISRFKVVLSATPPGSTYHEKAKTQLAALQP